MSRRLLILPDAGLKAPAIIIPSTRNAPTTITSYDDLNAHVASFQPVLAQIGIGSGDKVALILPNGLEFVVAFLALVRQRAVAAPINPQYKQCEYDEILRLMKPAAIITTPGSQSPVALAAQNLQIAVLVCKHECGQPPMLQQDGAKNSVNRTTQLVLAAGDVRSSDNALLLYTSGTTGPPKAVMLTHENLVVAMDIIINAHGLSPTDRCMLITPLFHVAGLGASLLTSLFSGGCAIIPASLPAAFWEECCKYGATWFHAVPTLHRLLLSFPRPEHMPKLRFIRSGGSDLSPELFRRLEKDLDTPLLEIYGMTETAPGIFCNRFDAPIRLPAHYPIPVSVEVKILPTSSRENGSADMAAIEDVPLLTDEVEIFGEICLRGRSIMSGYVDNPKANQESFLENGFFRTGDLGVIHSDGYLQLMGRIKELINKGGEKISPTEIEHIVLSHDAVREAACFGIPDEFYGEVIGIAIVLHPGKELKAGVLKAYVRERAALFKVPSTIKFVDTIPTNRTGKPQRILLSKQFGG